MRQLFSMYTLKFILASIFVWVITVLSVSGVSGFTQKEVTEEDIVVHYSEFDLSSGATEIEGEADLSEISDSSFKDGTYNGAADGPHGPIKVQVIVENGSISDVEILEHSEVTHISGFTLKKVPEVIEEINSPDIDVTTGATVTSRGIVNAVINALEDARL